MKKISRLMSCALLLTGSFCLIAHDEIFLPKEEVFAEEVVEQPGTDVLRIYNWEDYIYEPEDEEEASETPSTIDQFKAYYEKTHPGRKLTIVYDTFDTNETMLNQMKLGKTAYDLVCPSEYAIERMISMDMLYRLPRKEDGTYTNIPNYSEYASPYFQKRFDEQKVHAQDENGKPLTLRDYCIGYMLGTVGLLYNQTDKVVSQNEDKLKSWDGLWDEVFHQKIALKDSMRDTYIPGVMYSYREELKALKTRYEQGEITVQEYNSVLSEIFNRCSPKTLELVEKNLKELKKNIYGFEVDSGKLDIVKGRIAIDLAWSGDAVFSMDLADERNETLTDERKMTTLCFQVPEEGSNIWFDGWCIPKNAKNKEIAQEFMNFISQPEIAILNMDYIGYTSFIAGEEVLQYVRDTYEVTDGEEQFEDDLTYFFEGTVEEGTNCVVISDEMNRQLFTQFPEESVINRCAFMEDFGDNNELVVAMWTRVRAIELTTGAIVLLVLIGAGIVIGVSSYMIVRAENKKHRIQRRKMRQLEKNA